MRTVVYQSYRTHDVPTWITRCLQTVRDWTAAQGFEYRFLDDRLFTYAPAWYRQKVANHILLVSDLARLLVARELLAQDCERAIWIDADVLIFNPERFVIDVTQDFAFCHEVWVARQPDGSLLGSNNVNNAVSVFVRGSTFLDFYIDACQTIVRAQPTVGKLDVGTRFLTGLKQVLPFTLLTNVALLNPVLLQHVTQAPKNPLRAYRQAFGHPFQAANLCSSFRNSSAQGIQVNDRLFDTAIDVLVQTRGGSVAD